MKDGSFSFTIVGDSEQMTPPNMLNSVTCDKLQNQMNL
jgi:hypothetical protein